MYIVFWASSTSRHLQRPLPAPQTNRLLAIFFFIQFLNRFERRPLTLSQWRENMREARDNSTCSRGLHCIGYNPAVYSPHSPLLSYCGTANAPEFPSKAGAGCLVWCSTYFYRPYLSSSVFVVQIERLEQILYKLSPFKRDDSFLMESGQIFL